MAYLSVDYVFPIALLVAAILGVVLVRLAAARGERAAKLRTARLIEQYAASVPRPQGERDGMRDRQSVSIE